MENERIEYLRKNGRKHGKKKGVLWCGIDPDNENAVILGFSLCHSIDRFDWINGQMVKGFGLATAKERAEKWRFHSEYFVQRSHHESEIEAFTDGIMALKFFKNPDTTICVEIPPSVIDRLYTFIVRCKKYYKDKAFPEWCENVLEGNEIEGIEMYEYEV